MQVPNRPRKREPASIHVRAGDNSTISYVMPIIASPNGYEPSLEVHLDTVTITSSLNDIRLVTAETCRVGLTIHLACSFKRHDDRYATTVALLPTSSIEMERTEAMDVCHFSASASVISSARSHQHVHRSGQRLEFRTSEWLLPVHSDDLCGRVRPASVRDQHIRERS